MDVAFVTFVRQTVRVGSMLTIKPRVVGLPEVWNRAAEEGADPSEWSSLVGDLAGHAEPRPPQWRVHDRTHLEFAVDYRLSSEARRAEHRWDAYFFIPESLDLNVRTYQGGEIYKDLRSYVRFAVPHTSLDELQGRALDRLDATLQTADEATSIREMRFFACQARASGLAARRALAERIRVHRDRDWASGSAMDLVRRMHRLTEGLRRVLEPARARGGDLQVAAAWVDEDVSRLVETILASVSKDLRAHGHDEELCGAVAYGAVAQACYRDRRGCPRLVHDEATKRNVERVESRRHVLKRFTSSVLWLEHEVKDATRWLVNLFYALSASIAMAFALVAALYHGPQWSVSPMHDVWAWGMLVVLAYAGKDRIKAELQRVSAGWIARHFPNRRWLLRDREQRIRLGTVVERSGFVPRAELPEEVATRRADGLPSHLESLARPEQVFWHQKLVRLKPQAVAQADDRFESVTEIFRLDLSRWLAHTDDPKRRILFADPTNECIYSANAPRVYEINIVYRLQSGEAEEPWQRIRVFVSRKGLVRLEPAGEPCESTAPQCSP